MPSQKPLKCVAVRTEHYRPLGQPSSVLNTDFISRVFSPTCVKNCFPACALGGVGEGGVTCPDETIQVHSGDLMEQSARCHILWMGPFRSVAGDLIPTGADKSSSENPVASINLWKDFVFNKTSL